MYHKNFIISFKVELCFSKGLGGYSYVAEVLIHLFNQHKLGASSGLVLVLVQSWFNLGTF